MQDFTNKPDLRTLQENLRQSQGYQRAQVGRINKYYDIVNCTGSKELPKQTGRGKKTSRLMIKLAKQHREWRIGVLTEPLAAGDALFQIKPRGLLDREAAYQNQQILNYQFSTQMNKRKFIDNLIHNLVTEGTAIIKTGWEHQSKVEEVEEVSYKYQQPSSPMKEANIAQALQKYQENPASVAALPTLLRKAVYKSAETGMLVEAVEHEVKMVEKEVITVNRPTAEICDYRNVYPDPTCGDDLDKAQFVIYSYDTTIANLKALGDVYYNLDNIRPDLSPATDIATHTHLGTYGDPALLFAEREKENNYVRILGFLGCLW